MPKAGAGMVLGLLLAKIKCSVRTEMNARQVKAEGIKRTKNNDYRNRLRNHKQPGSVFFGRGAEDYP